MGPQRSVENLPMALISIQELSIGFRGPPLLDEVNCQIEAGQKIGLLGRNGAGKTTFMRMLNGLVEPDAGRIDFAPGTTVSLLPQDVPEIVGTVQSIVAQGANQADPEWQREQAVEQTMSRMQLDATADFSTLSSGMKRRVLLARSLAGSPDVLLLDEPTNHLDIDAIQWLEGFLSKWSGTLIFVTHDRMFLRKLADRILEVDRGRLFDWSCDYDTFLTRKAGALAAEEKQQALFERKLAEEEVWIRQGIKARRTRNEGRVRALKQMRTEWQSRPRDAGSVRLRIQEGQRSGNLVAHLNGVSFAFPDKPIVTDFSTMIMRGDKVGIIGANGAGKTTLLRILLGRLEPDSGEVKLGTNLQIAYFDQLRAQLHEDRTVQENVADGYDTVQAGGRKQHVIGYLQNFLFTPERARTPVRFLSGGERNRILLAKLFGKPANVIVLDEPTNDLDSETLELLEERLVDFQGTILLVSHDREFLNNVVTSSIVFEPDGVREYVGGYDDWVRQRPAAAAPKRETETAEKQRDPTRQSPRRLTFKEQQELKALPEAIERIEAEIAVLHEQMADPAFYQQPGERIAADQGQVKSLQQQVVDAYARWEELEQRSE